MGFGKMGATGGFGSLSPLGGVLAASYGRAPAPAGYHYEFVILNGQRATLGQPLVIIVKG